MTSHKKRRTFGQCPTRQYPMRSTKGPAKPRQASPFVLKLFISFLSNTISLYAHFLFVITFPVIHVVISLVITRHPELASGENRQHVFLRASRNCLKAPGRFNHQEQKENDNLEINFFETRRAILTTTSISA